MRRLGTFRIPTDANVVLDLTSGDPERIADGDVHVAVGLSLARVAVDHNHLAREEDLDANVELVALGLVVVWRFDSDLARRDAITELLQLLRLRPYEILDRWRVGQVVKRDLKRCLNGLQ